MESKEAVIAAILDAFGSNEYPGDDYLQGSFEGCEPYEEIAAFKGKTDWKAIDAGFLDAHSAALNFFSEAGLRFYLPAYLVADIKDELKTADPIFVLTHGFSDITVEHRVKERVLLRKTGKTAFVNPRRYGGMTFYDYACFRLSIFTREEAKAIVAYLLYKRDSDPYKIEIEQIDAALNEYWYQRAADAPLAESLIHHLREEDEYIAAISSDS
jgi:hypothetical protein